MHRMAATIYVRSISPSNIHYENIVYNRVRVFQEREAGNATI